MRNPHLNDSPFLAFLRGLVVLIYLSLHFFFSYFLFLCVCFVLALFVGFSFNFSDKVDRVLNMNNPVFDIKRPSTKIEVVIAEIRKLVQKKEEGGQV